MKKTMIEVVMVVEHEPNVDLPEAFRQLKGKVLLTHWGEQRPVCTIKDLRVK